MNLGSLKKVHPGYFSEKMELSRNHNQGESRDAAQDYPESGPEIQVFCVFEGAVGGL
ncbi:MAG: hypothetical protein ACNA7J_00875 [Wenzhouxiangella sp.]